MGSSHDDAQRRDSARGTRRSVLIVDDHRAVADLLRLGVDAESDLHCVGVAYDLVRAESMVAALSPDVVVTDLHFGEERGAGLALSRRLTASHPGLLVLLLTGDAGALTLEEVLDSGACGLLGKDGDLARLIGSIRSARPGELTVEPRLLAEITRKPDVVPVRLSPREQEVLELLAVGLDVRAASSRLGIRESTGRSYVKSLLLKLDAHSQLEAVATARRLGLPGVGDA